MVAEPTNCATGPRNGPALQLSPVAGSEMKGDTPSPSPPSPSGRFPVAARIHSRRTDSSVRQLCSFPPHEGGRCGWWAAGTRVPSGTNALRRGCVQVQLKSRREKCEGVVTRIGGIRPLHRSCRVHCELARRSRQGFCGVLDTSNRRTRLVRHLTTKLAMRKSSHSQQISGTGALLGRRSGRDRLRPVEPEAFTACPRKFSKIVFCS